MDRKLAYWVAYFKKHPPQLKLKKSDHSEWMDDCVPAMLDAGKDQDQAIAICLHMWDSWSDGNPGRDDPNYDGPQRPPTPEPKKKPKRSE
jgi:hypothetical protein